MNVSFFNGNIGNTKTSQQITIGEFLNFIRYEKFKAESDRVAAIEDKKERDKLKTEILPYCTVSGVFSKRSEAGLLQHSGLLAIDIDGVKDVEEIKDILTKDPYSFSVFTSVSGKGICVIVKTSTIPDNHKDHFRWAEKYYYDTYSLVIDKSCKDVSRSRFVSCDKDIRFNEKSKKVGLRKLSKTKPREIKWVATDDQMDRITQYIIDGNINIADSYDDYMRCAFAIANGFQESGREYFHRVASVSDKYDFNQAEKQYHNACKTVNKISIGTFYWMADQAGVPLRTKEEETAFAIARAAKRNKSDIDSAVQTAVSIGADGELTRKIAEQVFKTNDLSLSDSDISIIEEATAFIAMNTSLKRNEITYVIENNGKQIDDIFINSIYLKTKIALKDKMSSHDVRAIIDSDFTKSYNPINDWLKENEHLEDDPSIIESFLDCIPYVDPRARSFVRSWLLGIPAIHYGDVVRLVLCLCGKQETGKSEWYRRLLPEALQPYYAESNLMKDGDDAQVMSTNMIVMDDEMGGKSKKDAEKFKELTSKKEFTLRLPYGRSVVKMPRRAILCGTSNDTQVINDQTGNTRILPVEFNEKYNYDLYNSIDKNHLFIQLFKEYKKGNDWRLDEDAKELLVELSVCYSIPDAEEELINLYLEKPNGNVSGKFMSNTEIRIYLEKCSGIKTMSTRKLGIALKNNFERKVTKINGKTERGYICVTINNVVQHINSQGLSDDMPF